MTVVTLASRRAVPPVPCVHASAQPAQAAQQAHELHLIQLHAQACNALHMALHHLTSADCSPAMWVAATTRAHRGLAALKQASALVNQAGG